jgi:hypothetical protein
MIKPIICKISTGTTPPANYLNVKRISAELSTGYIEIYSNHQDLVGALEDAAKIEIEMNNDDTIITYLIQYGALVVKDELEYTLIEVYARAGLIFTEEVTLALAEQQWEGIKKEFLSMFNLVKVDEDIAKRPLFELIGRREEINKIDFGPLNRTMRPNFHRLQSELFFWQRVIEILKERNKK